MNVIGLDIGGTKITGIVFDGKKALKALTIPTPKSLPSFRASAVKLVETLSIGQKIAGIGVGMAGLMDQKRNTLLYSPNLKFIHNFDFSRLFPAAGKIRTDNDANCFALAESLLGQGKNFSNFVGLTIGTGLGGGLVFNKQVYLGAHGLAGEPGSMMFNAEDKLEYFYQKAKDASNYKQVAKIIGAMLINIYTLLDPEAVVIGGGLAQKHGSKFLPEALNFLQSRYKHHPMEFKVLVSNLENAGALGAALLLNKK